jgi:hypothetical protein
LSTTFDKAFIEGDRKIAEIDYVHEIIEDKNNAEEIKGQLEKLDELSAQASRSIYGGNSVSIVFATIVLINMAVIHGVSNAFINKLLMYFSNVLLPQGNLLPKSHYLACKLIRKLDLNYNLIH